MATSVDKLSKITFVVILALSVILLIYTYTLTEVKSAGYLSRMSLPKVLLLLMVILSAILTFQEWRVPQRKPDEEDVEVKDESLWPAAVVFVTTAIYALFFEDFGFMVMSIFCSLITLRCFQIKSWLVIVLYAILVPLVMLILFHNLLGLPIPMSPFSYYF
ncbi:tripartite tricarboxylate transporter TctB family protein [Paenalcaligenes sp. Me131]|uniref:tripartite tricarboxylate transporter TctB family protein n=1 Tax=Paenalcaligenes sp. Me131 TaxID=3392636 RepID=UPI003D2937D4